MCLCNRLNCMEIRLILSTSMSLYWSAHISILKLLSLIQALPQQHSRVKNSASLMAVAITTQASTKSSNPQNTVSSPANTATANAPTTTDVASTKDTQRAVTTKDTQSQTSWNSVQMRNHFRTLLAALRKRHIFSIRRKWTVFWDFLQGKQKGPGKTVLCLYTKQCFSRVSSTGKCFACVLVRMEAIFRWVAMTSKDSWKTM